jgi:hypothetical protein
VGKWVGLEKSVYELEIMCGMYDVEEGVKEIN